MWVAGVSQSSPNPRPSTLIQIPRHEQCNAGVCPELPPQRLLSVLSSVGPCLFGDY